MSACHSLSLARRVHIYISKQGKNLTPKTMNETWKNPTETTYMENTIYVEKDRKKGKKERRKHGNIHI
jgi:hypothetical protein